MRRWRKPLVVFTPKSLLREPRATSSLQDCANEEFQRIIPDRQTDPKKVRRVLLCAGKIFYELQQQREALKREDVAIIRLEQLYPLAEQLLQAEITKYAAGTQVLWVQEEPENMGAWRFLKIRFGERMFNDYPFAGLRRPASASPATGSLKIHKRDQKFLITQAFAET
jgi:2-oxoglutarate dehydrogenase E1 component